MNYLYSLDGRFVAYETDDMIYARDGEYIGYLLDGAAYSVAGAYLGEIMQEQYLLRPTGLELPALAPVPKLPSLPPLPPLPPIGGISVPEYTDSLAHLP